MNERCRGFVQLIQDYINQFGGVCDYHFEDCPNDECGDCSIDAGLTRGINGLVEMVRELEGYAERVVVVMEEAAEQAAVTLADMRAVAEEAVTMLEELDLNPAAARLRESLDNERAKRHG